MSLYGLDYVYLRCMLDMMGYKQRGATPITQDNNVCIFLVKGSGMYNRARHIDTRVYHIRELATGASPEVILYEIVGGDQPSDIFTKGLPRPAFEKHRAVLMGEVQNSNENHPKYKARSNADGRPAMGSSGNTIATTSTKG